MRTATRCAALAAGLILIVAACGGNDDSDSESTSAATDETAAATSPSTEPVTSSAPTDPPQTTPTTPETTEAESAPEPTTPAAPELPETPANAPIEQAYDFAGAAPDPDLLPAQPGDVTARWYRAGAVYAVVYDGLDPEAPACPGNSAQTTAGFDFISNAPLPGTTCDSFPTLIESNATQGIQICGDRVSYLTLIPSDFVAVLYASIEREIDDGGVGLTGFVLVEDPMTLPEIDPAELAC